MPTVLRVDGYRFFFYSNENKEPPHVHVDSAENTAKFWLRPITLVKYVGYNSQELHRLEELVQAHQEELEKAWNEHFD